VSLTIVNNFFFNSFEGGHTPDNFPHFYLIFLLLLGTLPNRGNAALVISLSLENFRVRDEAREKGGKKALDGEVLNLEGEVGELMFLEVVE